MSIPPRRPRALLLVGFAGALLCAGCPGDSGSTSPPSTPAPASASPSASPIPRASGTPFSDGTTPVALGSHEWLLPPGHFAEVDFGLRNGAWITADFKAGAAIYFDAHAHEGQETIIYGQGEQQEAAFDFKAPREGVYSFLFANDAPSGPPISVRVSLTGNATVFFWTPVLDEDDLPPEMADRARGKAPAVGPAPPPSSPR